MLVPVSVLFLYCWMRSLQGAFGEDGSLRSSMRLFFQALVECLKRPLAELMPDKASLSWPLYSSPNAPCKLLLALATKVAPIIVMKMVRNANRYLDVCSDVMQLVGVFRSENKADRREPSRGGIPRPTAEFV